jgi:pyruvate formate lyase activating enzyme
MEAAWWHPQENGQAVCTLCPVGCRLRQGQEGPCGTRANRQGTMVPLHYGRLASLSLDPIEKKPLYHFHPGRPILSVAAPGCNLHCQFCQNWNLSQERGQATRQITPEQLVQAARQENSVGLAFTYSEPLVWFEFVRDTSRAIHQGGLKNVLVTNGYLNREPLAELLPFIDAANIDLKSMDDRFYRRVCKARLEPVLAAVEQFLSAGVHVELTNLVIPGHNDSDEQLARLVDFVASQEQKHGRAIPLHFSAYHPAWKMKAPATPRATLLRAREIAARRLPWVYLGNLMGSEGRDSHCPQCGHEAVTRSGFQAAVAITPGASCPRCGCDLPFVLD